jgi:hypothetical protein
VRNSTRRYHHDARWPEITSQLQVPAGRAASFGLCCLCRSCSRSGAGQSDFGLAGAVHSSARQPRFGFPLQLEMRTCLILSNIHSASSMRISSPAISSCASGQLPEATPVRQQWWHSRSSHGLSGAPIDLGCQTSIRSDVLTVPWGQCHPKAGLVYQETPSSLLSCGSMETQPTIQQIRDAATYHTDVEVQLNALERCTDP